MFVHFISKSTERISVKRCEDGL